MTKSKLRLLIANEYKTDISTRSFWISTLLIPVIYIAFSILMGFLMEDSDAMRRLANPSAASDDGMSGWQTFGMIAGVLLALFLMIYGSQIFSKVRKEKVNRIMEVLATCVDGRTMMLAKIISVFLIGLTQIGIWLLLAFAGTAIFLLISASVIPLDIFREPHLYVSFLWMIAYFIGGYLFYGSLYAACGAMTDKDNENQGYMTTLTMILLVSFYIAQYAVDNGGSVTATVCSFIPFTAPAVGTVGAVTGDTPLWISIVSAVTLYIFAFLSVSLSGKIYTSSLLLKGRKFSFGDIMVFLKSK